MNIIREPYRGWMVLHLEGQLAIKTINRVRVVADEYFCRGDVRMALELSRTAIIDSSGISFIVNLHKRAIKHGGDFVLINPNQDISILFSVSGIEKHIRVFESYEAFRRSVPGATDTPSGGS